MRRSSRRFQRRSASVVVAVARRATTRGTSSIGRARGRNASGSRSGSSSDGSATTADDSERDAHASATSAVAQQRVVARARRRAPDAPRAARSTTVARRAAGRPSGRCAADERRRREQRRRAPGMPGSVAYPGRHAPAPRRRRAARPRRRRPRGQRGAHPRRLRAGRGRGLRPRRVPRAGAHRLPARGPAAAAGVRRRRPARCSTSSRPAPAARAAVVGFPEAGRDLYNAAAVCANGRVHGVYRKHLLPNYAVFDEQRYFTPSTVDGPLFVVGGRAGRGHDLRGRVEPDRPDHHAGGRRRRARRQHQRVAVLRGPAPRARDDARDPCRRRVGARRST